MDVCGRVAAIFKILPVLVSFHSGACCAGRKHPTKRKKSANKTSTVCLPWWGLAQGRASSAGLGRTHTLPPVDPCPTLQRLLPYFPAIRFLWY